MPVIKPRAVALLVIVAIAVARIASTYRTFSVTQDEPAHIGAGMEWLANGTYRLDPLQPPLARIAVAIGPYLAGSRFHRQGYSSEEGLAVLRDGGPDLLTSARAGTLLFVVIGIVAVYLLGKHLFGVSTGLWAAVFLSTAPPFLGHGGLATTDVAAAALFALLLFTYLRWLETPDLSAGARFGVVSGLALVTKYSLVPFFGLAGLGVALAYARWRADNRRPRSARSVSLALGGLCALLVVWSVFRFRIGEVHGWPVPARGLLDGIRMVAARNSGQDPEYVLRHVYQGGVWYFFPVAVLFKTPLSMLVLGIAGYVLVARRAFATRDWRTLCIPVAAASILAVAMDQTINIGLRHVLPLYPLLAICAAVSLTTLWRRLHTPAGRLLLVIVTVAGSWSAFRTHPDYLAYFNELAGDDPGRILVDSDLDWGQDLYRLRDSVQARGIRTLYLSYYGRNRSVSVAPTSIPWSVRDSLPTGWWAVSEYFYRFRDWSYNWQTMQITRDSGGAPLDSLVPVERVGRSIRLYCIMPLSDSSSGTPAPAVEPPCPR